MLFVVTWTNECCQLVFSLWIQVTGWTVQHTLQLRTKLNWIPFSCDCYCAAVAVAETKTTTTTGAVSCLKMSILWWLINLKVSDKRTMAINFCWQPSVTLTFKYASLPFFFLQATSWSGSVLIVCYSFFFIPSFVLLVLLRIMCVCISFWYAVVVLYYMF